GEQYVVVARRHAYEPHVRHVQRRQHARDDGDTTGGEPAPNALARADTSRGCARRAYCRRGRKFWRGLHDPSRPRTRRVKLRGNVARCKPYHASQSRFRDRILAIEPRSPTRASDLLARKAIECDTWRSHDAPAHGPHARVAGWRLLRRSRPTSRLRLRMATAWFG